MLFFVKVGSFSVSAIFLSIKFVSTSIQSPYLIFRLIAHV